MSEPATGLFDELEADDEPVCRPIDAGDPGVRHDRLATVEAACEPHMDDVSELDCRRDEDGEPTSTDVTPLDGLTVELDSFGVLEPWMTPPVRAFSKDDACGRM
jgi:hypothetical protein